MLAVKLTPTQTKKAPCVLTTSSLSSALPKSFSIGSIGTHANGSKSSWETYSPEPYDDKRRIIWCHHQDIILDVSRKNGLFISNRKPKGFAFVTFVLPENAVSAFSKLNGTSFQGRLLHLLPGELYFKMWSYVYCRLWSFVKDQIFFTFQMFR